MKDVGIPMERENQIARVGEIASQQRQPGT